jgi:hypothetical protein
MAITKTLHLTRDELEQAMPSFMRYASDGLKVQNAYEALIGLEEKYLIHLLEIVFSERAKLREGRKRKPKAKRSGYH